MNIELEKKAHAEWFRNEDPTAYQNYLDGKQECINGFVKSEKTWLTAKAQAVPEGYALIPREISNEWMFAYVDPKVKEYYAEFEGVSFAPTQEDLPSILEDHHKPLRNAHALMMRIVDAHDQKKLSIAED